MLTEEEKKFYKELQKIFRLEFWEGFALGSVIVALIAAIIILAQHIA